jgi:S1-C subfamily serine protease
MKMWPAICLLITLNVFASNDYNTLLDYEKNTIDVYRKVVPSTVNITAITITQNYYLGQIEQIPQGVGSGFIWDTEGHIVTNFHVAQNGDTFNVFFKDDPKPYKAKFLGSEPAKDIAVLKLSEKPKNLSAVTIGSSKDLLTGQKAIALGNPFGLDHSMSQGIISAIGRQIEGISGVKITGMIQTDAAINMGNSGGPLVNSKGELIGMNTQILSTTGMNTGLSFAVPVDTIKAVVPQIIKYGKVSRPGLGVGLLPDNHKFMFGVRKGLVISQLDPGGAAAKAGLEGMYRDRFGRTFVGDVIIEIDGAEVNTYDDIYQALDKHKVGDEVELKYLREGKTKKTKVKLTEIN